MSCLSNDFVLGGVLGRGTTGLVLRATKRSTLEEVALKVLYRGDVEWDRRTEYEFRVIQQASHPRIVRALDILLYKEGPVLVLELVGGQSINTLVENQGPLPEDAAKRVFAALMEAVRHLHRLGLCHRDIKPENVMVSPDLQEVKLIDFSTACRLQDGSLTPAGDRRTAPPEVLLGDSPLAEADVWGAGLCLYFLLAGCLPQKRDSCAHSMTRLRRAAARPIDLSGPQWERVSEECKSLLVRCLALDGVDRPSADDLCNSAWLRAACLQEMDELEAFGPGGEVVPPYTDRLAGN